MKIFFIRNWSACPVQIDEEDWDRVKQYTWYRSGNGAIITSPDQPGGTLVLSRFILNITDPKILIDHKDQNKFNNQKSNLRLSDKSLNAANQAPKQGKKFKCTYYSEERNNWQAYITVCKKKKHLGCFKTEEEAARAYDKAANRYFGEFAYLNFPIE